MNKQALLEKYGYFDMVHKVTLMAMAQVSDEKLDFRPVPEMRSIKELLSHTFGQERSLAESLLTRELTHESSTAIEGEGLKSKTMADLIAYARDCHQRAKSAIEKATEEQVTEPVTTFFGAFPGW